jgi:DNA-binding MarR family transcriptional regulator
VSSLPEDPGLSLSDYRRLADFRYAIRQFLHFSEEAARLNGFEPQQHQLLLAVKGLPEGVRPTITALSSRLCQKHHSTVELINRMVDRGFVVRRHGGEDRREALIDLTPRGEEALRKLSILHFQELQKQESALSETLQFILKQS